MVRFEFSTERNNIQPSYYFSDNWKHIQWLAILVGKEIEFGLENNWVLYWSQVASKPAGDCIWSKHGKNSTPRCKFLFSFHNYDETMHRFFINAFSSSRLIMKYYHKDSKMIALANHVRLKRKPTIIWFNQARINAIQQMLLSLSSQLLIILVSFLCQGNMKHQT